MRAPGSAALAAVLLGALGLRLAVPVVALIQNGSVLFFRAGDADHYREAALSLAFHGRYDGPDGRPELLRPPGYPALLVPGVLLGRMELYAVLVQVLLGTATVLIVYRAALRVVGDRRAALAAAALVALDPIHLLWGSYVMAETLLTTLLSLCFLFLVRAVEDSSPRAAALAGAACAAAAYAKPIAYYLAPALAAAIVLAGTSRSRPRAAAAGTLLGVWFLCVAPWQARNLLVADYAGFSSQLDRIVSFSAPAALDARRDGGSFEHARERRREVLSRGPETGALYEAPRRAGLERLADEPLRYAAVHLRGSLRSLFDPGALSWLKLFGVGDFELAETRAAILDKGLVAGVLVAPLGVLIAAGFLCALQAPLLLGALRGALMAETWRSPARRALVLVALALLVLSGGPWGNSRFRHPIVPLLALLAACAIERPLGGARLTGLPASR